MPSVSVVIDSPRFRKVLGQYPTGVSVVTGIDSEGKPAGLAVGTFTSVSLEPPLVAFIPARSSNSWPKIEPSGHFCVNVLGEGQERVCEIFATKAPEKFSSLSWRRARSGSPIISGVLAWIDCSLETVHEAGDHLIVVGRANEFDIEAPALPLVFFRGGFGRFAPKTMLSTARHLSRELRLAEMARPAMEFVTERLGGYCNAAVLSDGAVVVVASAGQPKIPRLVGARTPVVPPLGTLFMAFADRLEVKCWLDRVDSAERRCDYERRLSAVRGRGYSVALRSPLHARLERLWTEGDSAKSTPDGPEKLVQEVPYDPVDFTADQFADVRSLHVPVLDPDGHVALSLNHYADAAATPSRARFDQTLRVLRQAAAEITRLAAH